MLVDAERRCTKTGAEKRIFFHAVVEEPSKLCGQRQAAKSAYNAGGQRLLEKRYDCGAVMNRSHDRGKPIPVGRRQN